ncbi:MAG: hypothetical protein IJF32_13955, partial [Oscillospiraceae bacterium]|nr:hypothetical protein [Oscillospiraceae bacterium]
MPELKVGFARVDITPMLGTKLAGYYYERKMEGILDPLLATAVAFDDGEKRAIVMSVDNLGFPQTLHSMLREKIAAAAGVEESAIFVHCTHTHLAPHTWLREGTKENPEYVEFMLRRLADVSVMAVRDLAPAELYGTRGKAEGVSFIRRYEMRDGSILTNPGYQNPDIVKMHGEPDETSQLIIVKREGKPEIGIVNFQTHPDTTGGN